MFKQLKLRLASRRIEKNKTENTDNAAKKPGFWAIAGAVASWPFRMIGRGLNAFWQWVRCIDMIGLTNSTLLVAIIVLFSMLIIDVYNCSKKTVVLVPTESKPEVVAQVPEATVKPKKSVKAKPAKIVRKTITLPIKKTAVTPKPGADNIEIVEHKAPIMHGDIIIDGEFPGAKVSQATKINGNLYLQNMRKYTLPCGLRIDGDLFLRNVAMLQFCGDFVVTGDIYVTRNSSFGPIPRTARVGGQIIF